MNPFSKEKVAYVQVDHTFRRPERIGQCSFHLPHFAGRRPMRPEWHAIVTLGELMGGAIAIEFLASVK